MAIATVIVPPRNLMMDNGSNVSMTDAEKAAFLAYIGGLPPDLAGLAMTELAAQNFRYVSGASPRRVAGGTLMQALSMNGRTLRVLIVGDSTGYDTCVPGGAAIFDPAHAWPRLTATALGVKFPAYTVTQRNIDVDATLAWLSPTTLQTGTGANTLEFWDASVPGSLESWSIGGRWAQVVTGRDYDLIIVNYGHNYPNNLDVRDRMVAFLTDLQRAQPSVPILVTLQNWGGNSPAQKKETRDILARLANELSCDTYDAGQQFELYGGNASTQLNGDLTHPTIFGQQVWSAGLMGQQFSGFPLSLPLSPSPLTIPARNYLPDPFFQRPLGASGAANQWLASAGDVTLTQNTSIYETGKVWGNQAARLDSNGSAEKYITLTLTPTPADLLGKQVNLGVRMYRPAANAVVNRSGLRVDSNNGSGNTTIANSDNQIPSGDAQDGFFWKCATFTVPADSAFLLIRINIAFTGSAAVGKVYVDRASLSLGDMIRDPAVAVSVPDDKSPLIIDGATGSLTVDLAGFADPRVTRTVRFTNLAGDVTLTNLTNAPTDSTIRLVNGSGAHNVTLTQANAYLPGGTSAVLTASDTISLVRGPVNWEGLGPVSVNS